MFKQTPFVICGLHKIGCTVICKQHDFDRGLLYNIIS